MTDWGKSSKIQLIFCVMVAIGVYTYILFR